MGSLLIFIVVQGVFKVQQGFYTIMRRVSVTREYLTANDLYRLQVRHHALRILVFWDVCLVYEVHYDQTCGHARREYTL